MELVIGICVYFTPHLNYPCIMSALSEEGANLAGNLNSLGRFLVILFYAKLSF